MTSSWTLKPGQGIGSLQLKTTTQRPVGKGEVRIAIKANSINARDIMAAMGQSPMPLGDEIIPLSDGAGIVEEIGEGVSRVAIGDRVVITFNPAHQSGPFESHMAMSALGEIRSGVLASDVVIEEMAVVKLADSISFEQAACLPCVAVTAWNALFESGPLTPGQTVLATGTGTVSLTAMLLAKAAGARFGITSSDDAKISVAKELGADFGINYHQRPDWDLAVRELTAGVGADVVLETAGPPSIATSIKAAAQGGRVMQIGFKGFDGPPINVLDLLVGGVTVIPVMVGSRVMLERVLRAVEVNQIEIPIHARFRFEESPRAFESFMSGRSFGKTIISAA
ncbi:MAG: NAD(P)-dependent alcohol dehydrogenase [Planctomycetota bacterium]